MVYRFRKTQELLAPASKVWEFLSKPENLVKLTPQRMNMEIISGADRPLYAGQMISMKVSPLPAYRSKWVSEITNVQEGSYFVDEQRSGPYSMWHHQHFVHAKGNQSEVEDIIHYRVPFGWLGRLLNAVLVKPQLERLFAYREKRLEQIFGKNTL